MSSLGSRFLGHCSRSLDISFYQQLSCCGRESAAARQARAPRTDPLHDPSPARRGAARWTSTTQRYRYTALAGACEHGEGGEERRGASRARERAGRLEERRELKRGLQAMYGGVPGCQFNQGMKYCPLLLMAGTCRESARGSREAEGKEKKGEENVRVDDRAGRQVRRREVDV